MKDRILVVGSLNMDMVIEMKKMPRIGESVMGRNITYIPGGKGGNQAFAAGKLGNRVMMLGCVGNDDIGKALVANLSEIGVDVSNVSYISEETTGMAVIYVSETGDNSIVVVPGANSACDIEFLHENEKLFRMADYIIFQLEIPFETVFHGIRKAKEMGKTVILNPAPAPEPEEIPEDIWGMIDYLTPNETETAKLSGIDDISDEGIQKGAARLLEKGVKNVLVTMGKKGAFLANRSAKVFYPARKAEAVDTTAAGDCFNGAFVTGLSEGMGIQDAVQFANIAASIAVERKGAQSSLPGREEVNSLWKGYKADENE